MDREGGADHGEADVDEIESRIGEAAGQGTLGPKEEATTIRHTERERERDRTFLFDDRRRRAPEFS